MQLRGASLVGQAQEIDSSSFNPRQVEHLAVQGCWEGLGRRVRTFLESALRQRLHSSSGKTERREPKSHFP